jgi:quinol monooxygenase YgiN
MIGAVATLTIQDGKQAEFEAVAKQLVAAVNANEPGIILYRLFKQQGSEVTYVFMEQYKDMAAVEAHRAADHFKTLGRQMGPFLNGAPVVTRMDLVE